MSLLLAVWGASIAVSAGALLLAWGVVSALWVRGLAPEPSTVVIGALPLVGLLVLSARIGSFVIRGGMLERAFGLGVVAAACVGVWSTARWCMAGHAGTATSRALPVIRAVLLVVAGAVPVVWVGSYLRPERAVVFGLTKLSLLTIGFVVAAGGTVFLSLGIRRRRQLARAGVCVGILLVLVDVASVGISRAHGRPAEVTTESAHRPNVVLISVDSLRRDSISGLVRGLSCTPNIDQLAQDSVSFSWALAAAPWTKPSVGSMLTGFPPDSIGLLALQGRLADGVPTLAERLADVGYRTAAFVSSPWLRPEYGLGRGFRTYHSYPQTVGGSFGERLLERAVPEVFGTGVTSERLSALAWDWVRMGGREPFFLWVHYLDPHTPYCPPVSFLPDSVPPQGMDGSFDESDVDSVLRGAKGRTPEERLWIRALYQAEVRYVDYCIGGLLRELRARGLYEDSLIILTSDHGEEFWEHGGFWHGHSVYNELIRVPLLVKLPRESGPHASDVAVSTGAIAGTVMDVCRLPRRRPTPVLGSLLEYDREADRVDPDVLSGGTYSYEEKDALITDGWKLIRGVVTGREELFDLRTDPDERRDCTASEGPRVKLIRDRLMARKAENKRLAAAAGATEAKPAVLSPAQVQQLRSLGYLR